MTTATQAQLSAVKRLLREGQTPAQIRATGIYTHHAITRAGWQLIREKEAAE